MTANSDDRREVARAMRDWADRYPQGDFTWGVLGSVHYRIDGADTRPSSNQEVLYMLADLIDPTCYIVPMGKRLPHCSRCGQPMLKPWPNFCPCCGARVVTDDGE